jgi:hypothetical protein
MKLKIIAFNFATFLYACSESNAPDKSMDELQVRTSKLSSMRTSSANGSIAVKSAEYITSGDTQDIGDTVFFDNRGNKQLAHDFVPGDPRRDSRTTITYHIDQDYTSDNGLTGASIGTAIDNGMNTWDAENCSELNITKIPFVGNSGFVTGLFGFGGSDTLNADVQHSGFIWDVYIKWQIIIDGFI